MTGFLRIISRKFFPGFDADLTQDSCQAQFFQARGRWTGSLWAHDLWEMGFSVDPPLRRESSQGTYGSSTKRQDCEGENGGKTDEAGERELALVVSVRCGKERDMTRG